MSYTEEEMEKIADLVVKKLLSDKVDLRHSIDALSMVADDSLMYHRIGEVAYIDKVMLTGPPSQYQPNPTAQGAGNQVIFHAYTFTPKDAVEGNKYPLITLPHQGIHANFSSGRAKVVREMIAQGYIIVAPEYRGSTGYGRRFYELIDYGGLESEDTFAARNFMVENCDLVDPERIGIMGWSHGGMHTLFNIFKHPEAYKVAHASVPVSDIVSRMGYKSQDYRNLFEAKYHIGKSASDNVNEYRRRSPAWNVPEYDPNVHPPLLVHTTRNDQDVNVLEVEHLIKSLKEKNWKFEYKIYPAAPGGHAFSSLDTKFAKGVRGEIYEFLARYLKPSKPNPLKKFIGSPNPLKDK